MNAPVNLPTPETPAQIRARQRARRDPFVCATLTRDTAEYGPVETDVIIWFEITSFAPGCPARIRYDENDHPAEPAEIETRITDIEFDGGEPDDAPGPITAAERATLTAWFERDERGRVYDAAMDHAPDDYYDRADHDYDRWRDEQMER